MAGGTVYHRRHGRAVLRSDLLRLGGWLLLILALLLLAVGLTLQWLG